MTEKELDLEELSVRWGSAASEVMQDYPSLIYSLPDIEGAMAYRIINGYAIVFGDPLCPDESLEVLMESFTSYCKSKKLEQIFVITSEKFSQWAINEQYFRIMIDVCEELILDPFADVFGHSSKLKARANHAIRNGLEVKEYLSDDKKIEAAITRVGVLWRRGRHGPQIHLGHLNFFEKKLGKRWFYVEQSNKVIAMAMLCKMEKYNGWFLKFLLTIPNADKHTSELLMNVILEKLKNEHCHYLSGGMVPINSIERTYGLTPFSQWAIKIIFKIIKWVFKLEQRKAYWLRYHPTVKPSYVLFSSSKFDLKQLTALLKSFQIDKQR